MKRSVPVLAAAILLVGGVAYAQGRATLPQVVARQTAMDTVAANMKALSDMASGKAAFEPAAARAAAAAVNAQAGQVPSLFQPNVTEPASKASPKIWADWPGFLAQAARFEAGAKAIDPSSAATIAASLGGAGGTCRECHSAFRM